MRTLITCLLVLLGCSVLAEDHVVKGTDVPVTLRGVSEPMITAVEGVIAQQLDLSGDTEASSALADDMSFFVRRHYLAQGFLKADVAWVLAGKSILLTVAEGVQQHVGEVAFPGNPGLEVSELQRYLLRPTRERIGRFAVTTPYVEKECLDGLSLVHRYVLSQGYVDAEVAAPVAAYRDDGAVDLSVTITPGVQWHVGGVQVLGAPPLLEERLNSEAKALRDQPVNEAHIENMRRQLEGVVQARGYFGSKATVANKRGQDKHMDVTFAVVAGPLHQVTELQLDPAFSKGATRLVRSSFRPALDHVFDAQRMELAYGRVVDTGIFEHLEMEPKVVGDGALALVFSGAEAKRSSVGLSGGFDTFLGAILGLEYKNVNWWDSGGSLSAKLIGTQLGLLAGLQWKDPAIFNSSYALAIDVKPETFTFEGYTRHSLAVRVGLSREFVRHLSGEVYVGSSVNTVTSETLTELELGPADYTVGAAGMSLVYEGRDNPVAPTRGWYASTTLEGGQITGGPVDASFTRTELVLSYYRPITNKWRSAIGMHVASLISGEDVGNIPIELRNYNGGAKGVRSFAERELGPIAKDGTPLGGTQSQTVSGEISYEIVKNLEIAGFVDAGSLSTEKGSVLPNFDDIRYAAGIGFRYKLPFGPLRVDYGVNLDRRAGEAMGALHIGFGFAF